MRKGFNDYPPGWPEFARQLKEAAAWTCERCGAKHGPPPHVLTVHHLLMDKATPFAWDWAFAVLCQRCHLIVQAKVDMRRQWPFEHSQWFKWHAAGWYAHIYLEQDLIRPEIEARLEELLALERRI